jgi:hypothetical protein
LRTSDTWVLGRDLAGEAATTVAMDEDTAWRLYTKGLTPEEARPGVRIEGDRGLGEQMLRMVSIIA